MQPNLFGLITGMVLHLTSYSFGTILFYGQGAALVGTSCERDHLRFAGLRETGALGGIVLAAILPGLLGAYLAMLFLG